MAKSNTLKYKKGEIIFKEGDTGNSFYLIKLGSVDVVKGIGEDEIVIARLCKNEIFGEMAILGDKIRSATIRAAEDSEFLQINENVIMKKLPVSPEWIKRMFEILVKRLKQTNKKIKAHFRMGISLSVYNILSLILYKYGVKTSEGKKLYLDNTIKRINEIIGVSPKEIDNLFQELKFINIIKYSKTDNEIVITDENKFNEFLEFATKAAERKDFLPENFDELSEDDKIKVNYYKELLKILMRKYPDILVIS